MPKYPRLDIGIEILSGHSLDQSRLGLVISKCGFHIVECLKRL